MLRAAGRDRAALQLLQGGELGVAEFCCHRLGLPPLRGRVLRRRIDLVGHRQRVLQRQRGLDHAGRAGRAKVLRGRAERCGHGHAGG